MPKYNPDDENANLEALKKEMFSRAFTGITPGSRNIVETGSHAAIAYASLVRAQIELRNALADIAPTETPARPTETLEDKRRWDEKWRQVVAEKGAAP